MNRQHHFHQIAIVLLPTLLGGCGFTNKELSAEIKRLSAVQVDFAGTKNTFDPVKIEDALQVTSWQPAPDFDPDKAVPRIYPRTKINVNLLKKIYIFSNGKVSQNKNDLPFISNNAAPAYQTGTLRNDIFKRAKRYYGDNYAATIQDVTGLFEYQTFGEITTKNGVPRQFVSIGKPSAPKENVTLQATYRGAALGALNQQSHVYADVVAAVNFGEQKKMDIQFLNSQIANDDIKLNDPKQALTPAPNLDFREQLQWGENHFQGATTKAYFYGPHGEEMGGRFERTVSDGHYHGVYGMKKQ